MMMCCFVLSFFEDVALAEFEEKGWYLQSIFHL